MQSPPCVPRVSASTRVPVSKSSHSHHKATTIHSAAHSDASRPASVTARRPRANGHDEPPEPLDVRYRVGESERNPIKLFDWDFLLLLRHHLVSRLTGNHEALIPDEWKDHLDIKDDRAYEHKVISFNYSTCDMGRAQDSVNPRTHPDVMLLSDTDDDHPYWYARAVGVYHVNVCYRGPEALSHNTWTRIDFLWVRWSALDASYPSGFHHRRLPRLSSVSPDDPDTPAFSFLDPITVVRCPDNPYRLVSGANCRLMVFETVTEATRLWIKARDFSVARLLGEANRAEAETYNGGALFIFRLAPQDYPLRFHSTVDGTIGPMTDIARDYNTVKPQAIRSARDVDGENV
ncbi:hypothetical protein BN946_scf184718.g5 [Trametes cinnabarina]|uniref:Uncharacterized protein n=1 Tax=Pycnoporus cinnabarinus TaxID=5643 RepID=A0A060SJ63_PYCCI|nr:hypothetical protein BN946_scf184718.g5 [Trametes cinnabarina]